MQQSPDATSLNWASIIEHLPQPAKAATREEEPDVDQVTAERVRQLKIHFSNMKAALTDKMPRLKGINQLHFVIHGFAQQTGLGKAKIETVHEDGLLVEGETYEDLGSLRVFDDEFGHLVAHVAIVVSTLTEGKTPTFSVHYAADENIMM